VTARAVNSAASLGREQFLIIREESNFAKWDRNLASILTWAGRGVTKEEMEFHDIQVCGDWASEWATEHQVAQAPEGKPNFEGYGKMALVLHREAGGEWKIKQEMWNVSPKP